MGWYLVVKRLSEALDAVMPSFMRGKTLLTVLVCAVALGAGSVDTVRKVRSVPDKLDAAAAAVVAHDQRTHEADDSLLAELRRSRVVHERDLCLHIAQLKHTDWTDCLLDGH